MCHYHVSMCRMCVCVTIMRVCAACACVCACMCVKERRRCCPAVFHVDGDRDHFQDCWQGCGSSLLLTWTQALATRLHQTPSSSSSVTMGCRSATSPATHTWGRSVHLSKQSCTAVFLFYVYIYFILYTLSSYSGNSGGLTWVRLRQPQEQRHPVLQVHAGSFPVSVIH